MAQKMLPYLPYTFYYFNFITLKIFFMSRSTNGKRKIQLNKKTTSILLGFAIIIAGGLILKVMADKESNARIDY
jgi:hypothetical protein